MNDSIYSNNENDSDSDSDSIDSKNIDNNKEKDLNEAIIMDDILKFYYEKTLSICKTRTNCLNNHTSLCIHDQLFEMMKYLKPKYSDISIINSFTSLYNRRIIYTESIETIDKISNTNILQDMLIYFNNDFWTIHNFKPSLQRKVKTNVFMPMEAILENEYVQNDIFKF